jgi:hypothetical protein
MSKLSQTYQKLFLASLTSLCLGSLAAPSLAQWNGGSYRPSGNVGTPTRTQSGATRGTRGCPVAENSPSLVAVVPNNTFGVTLRSHPTFLFYLPVMTTGATPPPVEFVIRDLDDNDIYKVRFNTNGQGGIASISLPENSGVKGLELNKDYRWSVAIICQMNDRGRDIVTEGLIQRVAVPPELSPNALEGKSVIEEAEILSRAGIWYDSVALIAEIQRQRPLTQWTNILQAVELLDLVNQPLLDGRNSTTPASVPNT